MKPSVLNDNWPMGWLRDFYDFLVYRRAPLAPEQFVTPNLKPSIVDGKIIDLLELTDADYILVDADDMY